MIRISRVVASLFFATLAFGGCSTTNKQTESAGEQTTAGTHVASTTGAPQFVSYENALNTAKAENKVIFVDIYTDWCGWCKKLDKDVYSDARVLDSFAKNFTMTKINAESDTKHTYRTRQLTEREISTSWGVNAYPTLVFLDNNENPIFAYEGYLPPEKFVKLLTYVSSGEYSKHTGTFQSWLSSHPG